MKWPDDAGWIDDILVCGQSSLPIERCPSGRGTFTSVETSAPFTTGCRARPAARFLADARNDRQQKSDSNKRFVSAWLQFPARSSVTSASARYSYSSTEL
jgi:hypothetical protein